jgi:hypothetical protein
MTKKLSAAFLIVLASAWLTKAQQKEPEQAGPYETLVIGGATALDGSGAPTFGPVDISQALSADVREIVTKASRGNRRPGKVR